MPCVLPGTGDTVSTHGATCLPSLSGRMESKYIAMTLVNDREECCDRKAKGLWGHITGRSLLIWSIRGVQGDEEQELCLQDVPSSLVALVVELLNPTSAQDQEAFWWVGSKPLSNSSQSSPSSAASHLVYWGREQEKKVLLLTILKAAGLSCLPRNSGEKGATGFSKLVETF